MKLWKEFREFAFKGNVIDLAVGVIIGSAFGQIVSSLVGDVIMPIFGFATAGMDFKSLKWVMSAAELAPDGSVLKPEAALMYGNFIQNIVNFLIISFSIFLFVRLLSLARERARRNEAPAEPEAPQPPTQEELLTEIRDLLRAQSDHSTPEN